MTINKIIEGIYRVNQLETSIIPAGIVSNEFSFPYI